MSSGTIAAARGGRAAESSDLRARLRAVAPSDLKLHVPPIRSGIVPRAGLVDRARGGEPVVVISAPAGYGKTTLLSQWAAVDERPFVFLTLAESDNDLTVLVAYLVRALDAVDPLPTETLAAFVASGADGPTVLLPRLGRMLLDRPRPFVLALDDVHLLSNPECLSALGVIADHLPDGSQLVVASRQDPPMGRARLRARRALVEIRAEDLKLSPADGAAALREAGVDLDDSTADLLLAKTEGWPAGIYLAALAVRDHDNVAEAASRFTGEHRLVAEFLRDELVDGLPDDVVEFLVRSSVLEYLDGPGCDAVLNRSGSWSMLEELARSNLFVVPLDTTGEKFRYHHLFADKLRVRLRRREPEIERELHERASELFASRGQPNLAIEHARLAGDFARAAALLWQHAPIFIGTGRAATVERWLAPFTTEDLIDHPTFAVIAAWCCISSRELRPIFEFLGIAAHAGPDALLPDGAPMAAAVSLLEAVACEHGLRDMAAAAARAQELDHPDGYFRPTACYLEGNALLLLGQPVEARARFDEAIRTGVVSPGTSASSLSQLALIAAGSDEWEEAEHLLDRAMALVDEHHLDQLVPQVLTFSVLAYVQVHRGDTVGARRNALHARRLLSLLNHLAVWMAVEARVVLARVELALGDVEGARVLAFEARDLLYRLRDAGILPERIDALITEIDSSAQVVSELSTASLTTAELRVLAYLPTHLSFQAMAEDLFVSRNTVKTQAISIYRKLGVSSRAEAVERARELGLVEA
jgi:LuxR family transcriptional regulator, maltose regulon positive regulatory protein